MTGVHIDRRREVSSSRQHNFLSPRRQFLQSNMRESVHLHSANEATQVRTLWLSEYRSIRHRMCACEGRDGPVGAYVIEWCPKEAGSSPRCGGSEHRSYLSCSLSPTMGLLLSFPLAGVFGTVGSSCLAGLAFCFTSTAG